MTFPQGWTGMALGAVLDHVQRETGTTDAALATLAGMDLGRLRLLKYEGVQPHEAGGEYDRLSLALSSLGAGDYPKAGLKLCSTGQWLPR